MNVLGRKDTLVSVPIGRNKHLLETGLKSYAHTFALPLTFSATTGLTLKVRGKVNGIDWGRGDYVQSWKKSRR